MTQFACFKYFARFLSAMLRWAEPAPRGPIFDTYGFYRERQLDGPSFVQRLFLE